MKITCDLCGGALQINLGGKGATCMTCGLGYTMERLREKLNQNTATPVTPVVPTPVTPVVPTPVTPAAEPVFNFVPEQFVMHNNGKGKGDLSGWVQQGGIGLGDEVYIDADYAHPYRVYSVNDDADTVCVKKGASAELFLADCPKKVLKNARTVTGKPDPVANAYNYPGTVREYFYELFSATYSGCELRTQVPHAALNIPVSFMFYRNGAAVLAVFLVNSNDSKARAQVAKAARLLPKEGISCTHFYDNYRNDLPYVIQRVNAALGE